MTHLEKQCVCVKFCFKLRKAPAKTFQILHQAYGEDGLSRTQWHEWYQRFKSGRTSIEDDPKFGRPFTSMDDDQLEKVLAVICQNRRLTVREVIEEVGVCKSSCHLILTDKLKMRMLLQNLCHVCWQMHKNRTVSQSVRSCLIVLMLMKTFWKMS